MAHPGGMHIKENTLNDAEMHKTTNKASREESDAISIYVFILQ